MKHDDIPLQCPICGEPLDYYNRNGCVTAGKSTAWYTCNHFFEPDENGAWKLLFKDKEQPRQAAGGAS